MNGTPNLIHIAKVFTGENRYLFLRKVESRKFVWFESGEAEKETSVYADNIEEAIRLAAQFWKQASIAFLNCGFRYTLPERDEHGLNALFWQMVASYNSPSGIYFDEELGCNCIVHNASQEARSLFRAICKT